MRFGVYLAQAIEAKGLSQRKFSTAVGYKQANLSRIISGKMVPPLKHIQKWSDFLMPAIDPAEFRELALLENSPPEIMELVRELRRKLSEVAQ
jgi:transcriptional regulator with XRE-family HTH domain